MTEKSWDESDDSNDSVETTYAHSEEAASGAVTLKAEWNDPVLGQPTTFHVSATGGSGNYKFRMDAPSYSSPNQWAFESVADPSRGEWMNYTSECASNVKSASDMTVMGDVYNLCQLYNDSGIDKIIIFDLSTDDDEHEKNIHTIENINRNIDIKVCAGGNINRIEDVKKLLLPRIVLSGKLLLPRCSAGH